MNYKCSKRLCHLYDECPLHRLIKATKESDANESTGEFLYYAVCDETGETICNLHKDQLTNNEASLPTPTAPKSMEKLVKNSMNHIVRTIKDCTSAEPKGFHHPNKTRDKLIQQVINFLAKPGVVFSIYNACHVVISEKKQANTIYAWCHRHEKDIRQAVELRRTLQNSR